MSTMRIAVAGTGGLACLIAHFISEETTHGVVMLSRAVSYQRSGRCLSCAPRHSFKMLLIVSNFDPGQARTFSTRPSDHCRRLQRRRQLKVRTPRHRHRHLHRHRAKPNTLDQSSRVRSSPTLRTSRVRRTATASTSQRPSRSAADGCTELAAALQKQHRAYRVYLWHLLRAFPARWSAESFDRSQHGLSRRGQLYLRRREDERRVAIHESV